MENTKAKRATKFKNSFVKAATFALQYPAIAKIIYVIFYPYFRYCSAKVCKVLKKSIDKTPITDNTTEEEIQSLYSKIDGYLLYTTQLNEYKKIMSIDWFKKATQPHLKYVYDSIKPTLGVTYLEYLDRILSNLINPQQDLMLTVKEANHYMAIRRKRRKAWGFKKNFRNEKQVKKWFGKYHKKCNKEIKTLEEFMNLCSLDQKYGFIGMATMNPKGSTTIKVG